eukprot:CAMPEP_0117556704 /NCGR_PEP_ID=MMETSP0784-20121206/51947_1 /TAXON_ID=39447 /ORGANISM="" /LENGTH=975 /DNA_ID=CAMNT_0005353989 /DNA_START=53 /DNA_END=2980 /DNA_ORIENTATION=+
MAIGKPDREIPWCTIFLVAGALTCHILVLSGNLATAAAMSTMGKSSDGWSNVGLELSNALSTELDSGLAQVTTILTDVIAQIAKVQAALDGALGGIGESADAAVRMYLQNAESGQPGNLALLASRATSASLLGVGAMNLSSFSLDDIGSLELMLFRMLSDYLDGLGFNGTIASPDDLKKALHACIDDLATKLMGLVVEQLDKFYLTAKPALLQIGAWLITFGDKIQATITEFSGTLDKVQKIFDQVMAQISQESGSEYLMQYNTYTLFDVDQDGTISAKDVSDVSELYGIDAYLGDKGQELHAKYDLNQDGQIDKSEYGGFVHDPSVPGAMATVLRTFSKLLVAISGNVGAARMRDEVAKAVVKYSTTAFATSSRIRAWVSNRLTNSSVPIAFTADVMINLARDKDNPNKYTNAQIGPLVINEMYIQKPEYVGETLELLSTAKFWASEGFDPNEQQGIVKTIVGWMTEITKKGSLLQHFERAKKMAPVLALASMASKEELASNASVSVDFEDLPHRAAALVGLRSARHHAKRRARSVARLARTYRSKGAIHLRSRILGGVAASAGTSDPILAMALNSGVHAVPETLEFAKFLSWNASQTARRFQRYCFEYMSTSSSTMDSFADQIKGMVKKISTFLDQMMAYCTPSGMDKLKGLIEDFGTTATKGVVATAKDYVDAAIDDMMRNSSANESSVRSPVQGSPEVHPDVSATVLGSVARIQSTLDDLMKVLPDVILNLKDARKQVSAASSQLESIFKTFQQQGPPIFYQVAELYSTLWTVYFVLFAFMTLCVLFYGFWASGWMGGPQAAEVGDYEPPQTCADRMRACCRACGACMQGCHDSNTCFWSAVLLLQVVVLILFIVSIVLCLLAGVNAFISSGCLQIYILGDVNVCQGTLGVVKEFLQTFMMTGRVSLHTACTSETLVTCHLIAAKMKTSAIFTTAGSMLAAVLTFQMILEAAVMHERARWRRLFDAASKEA